MVTYIIRNLGEAKDGLSKTISPLLRAYEKKLYMYYREHTNLHQEILKRIPTTDFEEHDQQLLGIDQLHTEALLKIEQLTASLASKLVIGESERQVLESFQNKQRSEYGHEKTLHHVATTEN